MQARFIRIHTGLYLYACYFILTSIVKNDSSFTAQAVVIMTEQNKNERKKEERKTYFRLARFDPERTSDVPKDVTTRLRKLSRMHMV